MIPPQTGDSQEEVIIFRYKQTHRQTLIIIYISSSSSSSLVKACKKNGISALDPNIHIILFIIIVNRASLFSQSSECRSASKCRRWLVGFPKLFKFPSNIKPYFQKPFTRSKQLHLNQTHLAHHLIIIFRTNLITNYNHRVTILIHD